MSAIEHINDEQDAKIKEWHDNHICGKPLLNPKHDNNLCLEGDFRRNNLWYCISFASGIGPAIKGRCECGEEIDVTDVSTW